MKISKEELFKEIKKIGNRIKNQDPEGKRWGTAPPLWFLLQDVEERHDPVNGGDFLLYMDDDAEVWRGEDCADILKQYLEHVDPLDFGPLRKDPKYEKSEYEKYVDKLESDIESESYGMVHEFVTKYAFHTYDAAESHLKTNKHHYSDKARIYVDHAWRNKEAELIHQLLLTFAD